jgi:hypothetical protein
VLKKPSKSGGVKTRTTTPRGRAAVPSRAEQHLNLCLVWPPRPRTGALLARAAIYINEVPANTGFRLKQRATGERAALSQCQAPPACPAVHMRVVMAVLLLGVNRVTVSESQLNRVYNPS